MKYSEMSKQELEERIVKGPRFTAEEMSVEDAIALFKDEACYKSYLLLERVVPVEYLDNKEFFMGIIPTRLPLTYSSVFAYASPRLKNDPELVEFAIKKHAYYAIDAMQSYVSIHDPERLQYYKDNPDVYLEPETDGKGQLIGYNANSLLLKDKAFLLRMMKEQPEIIGAVLRGSQACSSDKEFVLASVELIDDTDAFWRLDNKIFADPDVLVKAIEKILTSKRYAHFKSLNLDAVEPESREFANLIKTCMKLSELPQDAKLRKLIFAKMAESYLSGVTASKTTEESASELE